MIIWSIESVLLVVGYSSSIKKKSLDGKIGLHSQATTTSKRKGDMLSDWIVLFVEVFSRPYSSELSQHTHTVSLNTIMYCDTMRNDGVVN